MPTAGFLFLLPWREVANALVISEPMENPNWLPQYRTAVLLPCYCPATALLLLLLPCYCPTAATAAITAILSGSNTSGYIILVVAAPPSRGSNSESPHISVTLDSAIYNYPWVKTSICKLILIKLKDCLCDLFTVIAKYSQVGNCLLLTINGSFPSIKVSLI